MRLTEAQIDQKQARCDHSWRSVFETINNRLVASTWCRKCMMTDFAFRQAGRAVLDEKEGE